jgi:hypothetical protein
VNFSPPSLALSFLEQSFLTESLDWRAERCEIEKPRIDLPRLACLSLSCSIIMLEACHCLSRRSSLFLLGGLGRDLL